MLGFTACVRLRLMWPFATALWVVTRVQKVLVRFDSVCRVAHGLKGVPVFHRQVAMICFTQRSACR